MEIAKIKIRRKCTEKNLCLKSTHCRSTFSIFCKKKLISGHAGQNLDQCKGSLKQQSLSLRTSQWLKTAENNTSNLLEPNLNEDKYTKGFVACVGRR